jgi:hypothetical protein
LQEDFLFKIHNKTFRRLKTNQNQNYHCKNVKYTVKVPEGLQTNPKIIIKWSAYQIENFPEKSMRSTLKAKTSSNRIS